MLSKSSAIFRTVSATRAFSSSTGTTSGSARKMQKLFIDYLDEAQQRSTPVGRHVSSSANMSQQKPAIENLKPASSDKSTQPKKMQKIFIEYLDEAMAKLEAQKNQKST